MDKIEVIQRELTKVRETLEHTLNEEQMLLIDELELLIYEEQREIDRLNDYRLTKEGE